MTATATMTEKSVLHILDGTGDTKLMWSKDNPDEVANAKDTFDKLKKKGFVASAKAARPEIRAAFELAQLDERSSAKRPLRRINCRA